MKLAVKRKMTNIFNQNDKYIDSNLTIYDMENIVKVI